MSGASRCVIRSRSTRWSAWHERRDRPRPLLGDVSCAVAGRDHRSGRRGRDRRDRMGRRQACAARRPSAGERNRRALSRRRCRRRLLRVLYRGRQGGAGLSRGARQRRGARRAQYPRLGRAARDRLGCGKSGAAIGCSGGIADDGLARRRRRHCPVARIPSQHADRHGGVGQRADRGGRARKFVQLLAAVPRHCLTRGVG